MKYVVPLGASDDICLSHSDPVSYTGYMIALMTSTGPMAVHFWLYDRTFAHLVCNINHPSTTRPRPAPYLMYTRPRGLRYYLALLLQGQIDCDVSVRSRHRILSDCHIVYSSKVFIQHFVHIDHTPHFSSISFRVSNRIISCAEWMIPVLCSIMFLSSLFLCVRDIIQIICDA